jgi:hypothetical protein
VVVVGLLVLLLLGDGLRRLLLTPQGRADAVGMTLLLGLAAVPWVCILFDLAAIPITALSLVAAAIVLALLGFLTDPPGWRKLLAHLARKPEEPREHRRGSGVRRYSPAAVVFAALIATLVVFSFVHVASSPPRTYDALVGYDLVGKILAAEGKLRSSVFTHLQFNAQCVYAPFTATNQGFWYIFHPSIPRLWVPLLTAGFALVAWGWIRRWTSSATIAGLALFLSLTPPELAFHLTVGQTDLPSMVFTALGIFATVDLLRGRGGVWPAALFLLLATTARSENALFAAALTLVVLIARRRNRLAALGILAPSLAFFLFWNVLFVKGLIGYDPAGYFRETLSIDLPRLREVVGFAAQVIRERGTFGELAWCLPLGLLLWLAGWWGRRNGRLDAQDDPQVSGKLLLLLGVCFVFYLPYFYQWNPELNPLWTMHHTFKRGFFRFVPGLVVAVLASAPVAALLRRCDPPEDI